MRAWQLAKMRSDAHYMCDTDPSRVEPLDDEKYATCAAKITLIGEPCHPGMDDLLEIFLDHNKDFSADGIVSCGFLHCCCCTNLLVPEKYIVDGVIAEVIVKKFIPGASFNCFPAVGEEEDRPGTRMDGTTP